MRFCFSTVPIFFLRCWKRMSTSRRKCLSSITGKGAGRGVSSTTVESTSGSGQKRERGTFSSSLHSAR
ncbi:MAG: hypothetical protein A4E29_00928 [Methanomassiliicoccales archaeon PtaB.Bin134]|nr:MAG: hypothetical protein A4E29_00928 [Methanomassiliicoccales archaeon PtaB.Bin134]